MKMVCPITFKYSKKGMIEATVYCLSFGVRPKNYITFKNNILPIAFNVLKKVDDIETWDKYIAYTKTSKYRGKYKLVDFFNSLRVSNIRHNYEKNIRKNIYGFITK
jgi:hypothetical protein